jgi:hypothetical protein
MLAGTSLFPTDIARSSHVAIMTVVFGDFPQDMIKRGKYSGDFFKNGNVFLSVLLLS